MPGLFLAYTPNTILSNPEILPTQTDYNNREVINFNFDDLAIFQISNSRLGHSYYQDPQGVSVWVYGAVFSNAFVDQSIADSKDPRNFAKTICHLYQKYKDNLVTHVNGEFNIIILDLQIKEILIVNDRFAIRPWYWVETQTGLFFAPSVNDLIPFLPSSPQLDMEITVGFLAFNKMRLGDRTLIKNISVLPAASQWKVNLSTSKVQKHTYWQFHYNENVSKEVYNKNKITDLVDCYKNSMNQRILTWPDARVGISLSGGLDSRTMIAATDKILLPSISAHTYGLPESDEVQLAGKVAATAGVNSYIYPLTADDYIDYAETILTSTDELDIFVQAAQLKFLSEAKSRIDVLMTGLDLDVTLGGIYLIPEIMASTSIDAVFDLIKQKNVVFSEIDLEETLTPGIWNRYSEPTYQMAYDLLKEIPQSLPAASYDHFINKYSMRRIIMLRYAQNRTYLETSSPMYDYDFVDLICNLPINERAKHVSFIPFLEALSKPLSEIVYQRTMLPANAPRKFWSESEEIERKREQLYFKIWQETRGKVHIPYRRYYTNFDEWLRIEPSWLGLSDNLLGNTKSRLFQMGLVKFDFVKKMLKEHRSGERSHRQRLIVLMSLELFLRKYF